MLLVLIAAVVAFFPFKFNPMILVFYIFSIFLKRYFDDNILWLIMLIINSNINKSIHLQIVRNKRPDTVLQLKFKAFGEGLLLMHIKNYNTPQ